MGTILDATRACVNPGGNGCVAELVNLRRYENLGTEVKTY